MTNQEKMALLMQTVNAIFQSKAQNTDITQVMVSHPSLNQWVGNQYQPTGVQNGRWFVNGTIRGFDLCIKVNERMLLIRVLEQNPNKTDAAGNLKRNALLARQGHQIAWVIDRRQENGWLGSVRDGQWHPNQPRATYPAVNTSSLPYDADLTAQIQRGKEVAAGAEFDANVGYSNNDDPLDLNELPDIPNHTDIPEAVLHYLAEESEGY